MTEWTGVKLAELSASLAAKRSDYAAEPGDRHYGATGPLRAPVCRCADAGLPFDAEADECWRCGRSLPELARHP